jgi:hypothetical protein
MMATRIPHQTSSRDTLRDPPRESIAPSFRASHEARQSRVARSAKLAADFLPFSRSTDLSEQCNRPLVSAGASCSSGRQAWRFGSSGRYAEMRSHASLITTSVSAIRGRCRGDASGETNKAESAGIMRACHDTRVSPGFVFVPSA